MTTSASGHPAKPENPWRTRLAVLTGAHVVGTLHITSLLVMAPVIRESLGLSFAEFGLLVTAYSTGQLTASLPAGHLSDRLGVGWALVIAHLILVIGALTLTQATGLASGLVAMLITGWGYAIVNPATSKGVFEAFPQGRRATAMGIKQTGVPIGGVIAAGIGSFVAVVEWQIITASVAVVTFLGGFLCFPIVEKPKPPPPGTRSRFANLGTVVRDINFSRFVLANFHYNVGQASFFAYLTLFMRESAKLSQEMAGVCYGAAQVASVAARLSWGAVSDILFKGRRKALTLAIGAVAALFLAAMLAVQPGTGLPVALVISIVLGITIASYAPLMQTMAVEAVEPKLTGSATGYNMVGTSIGSIIGPPLFGWVVDLTGTFHAGWLMLAAVVGGGVLLLGFGFREHRR